MTKKTAVLLAIFVLVATGAWAGTETVIWNFGGISADGSSPFNDLATDGAGNLYGETILGGTYGVGVVFKLSPNGHGGYDETLLYEFSGGSDGSNPYGALVFDGQGNLYGTTYGGGAYGYGAVFELLPNGTFLEETVIYSFGGTGSDGSTPLAGVVFDGQGNLYGTTSAGGTYGNGTVFELSPSGGSWTETILHSFNSVDGCLPYGPVMVNAAGNLFGTTSACGTYNGGTAFKLVRTPAGWEEGVLHNFGAPGDGGGPTGVKLISDGSGNLYGTTPRARTDFGEVWELVYSQATKTYSYEILHAFNVPGDGSEVRSGVAMDRLGNLYGVTRFGGAYSITGGTVYRLTRSGNGWNYGIDYSFTGGTDGGEPAGNLLIHNMHIYGMTTQGGTYGGGFGLGVVFEVTP
jgi:uncharacterized repeat protein (TIGR03803 family)